MYQTRWAKRIDQGYEKMVLDHCNWLLLVADDRDRMRIDPAKVLLLPNGFDEEDFEDKVPLFPDEFTVCYTGTISDSYPTAKLLDAFVSLKGEMPFKLRFVGKISGTVKEVFEQKLGKSVNFIDFVSHEEAIDYMLNSSVLLLIIAQTANNKSLLSGKIFEYLATSIPILLLGPVDGIAARIVRQAGSGDTFDYDDSEGIRNFLLQQYQHHLSQAFTRPDQSFIRQFSRKTLTKQLSGIIDLDDRQKID